MDTPERRQAIYSQLDQINHGSIFRRLGFIRAFINTDNKSFISICWYRRIFNYLSLDTLKSMPNIKQWHISSISSINELRNEGFLSSDMLTCTSAIHNTIHSLISRHWLYFYFVYIINHIFSTTEKAHIPNHIH